MFKQPFFAPQSAAVSDQLAVFADDAVTGYHDGDRVAAVGGADGPDGGRPPHASGNVLVGCNAAIRHCLQLPPDLLLEIGSFKRHFKIEFAAFAGEVIGHLSNGLGNQRDSGANRDQSPCSGHSSKTPDPAGSQSSMGETVGPASGPDLPRPGLESLSAPCGSACSLPVIHKRRVREIRS